MNAPSSEGTPRALWDTTEDSAIPAPDSPRDGVPRPDPSSGGFWAGRSGLVVPLIMASISTYLVYGLITMDVPEGTDAPGPQFYPLLLAVAGYVLSVLLVVDVLRAPQQEDQQKPRSQWASVAWLIGGFLVFATGIEVLGWIIAAALLFWCVARGAGSTRPVFDLSLALVFSSVIYLAFAVGLGLNLPSGLLGGL